MTDNRQQPRPEEISDRCQAWQEEHGKLNETNFIKCMVHFVGLPGMEPDDLTNIVIEIIQAAGLVSCVHCGAIPARDKDVNGTVFSLCSCCRDNILYQDLGPQEGYV